MIHKYLYAVGRDGFENASPFNSPYSEKFAKSVAEDAAELLYQYDEDSDEPIEWPLTLTIWDHSGKKLGTFDVEVEMEPVFYAYKSKES